MFLCVQVLGLQWEPASSGHCGASLRVRLWVRLQPAHPQPGKTYTCTNLDLDSKECMVRLYDTAMARYVPCALGLSLRLLRKN